MGLLRSTDLAAADGGYTPTCRGMTVNGVLLGEPILLGVAPITVGWDDAALPNGLATLVDGEVVVVPDTIDL